jgi:hypothetical protein
MCHLVKVTDARTCHCTPAAAAGFAAAASPAATVVAVAGLLAAAGAATSVSGAVATSAGWLLLLLLLLPAAASGMALRVPRTGCGAIAAAASLPAAVLVELLNAASPPA